MPKTSYNKFSPNLEKSSRVNKRKLVFFPQKNTQKILQKILKDVGLSENDIRKILKRWKGKKSFQDKPRKGRPRIISTSSQKKFESIIEKHPISSSHQFLTLW